MSASDPAALKRTPLYERHKSLGGKLVEFGGWEMPVQYSGIVDEHNAVRSRAGLFDVSHMGEIRVKGPKAFDVVQHITCNDVAALDDGKVQYSAMLTDAGTFVDDLLTYRLAADDYLLVINASNTPKDVAWALDRGAAVAGSGTTIVDESPQWAQVALQGPLAQEVLQPLVDVPLADIAYYRFQWANVGGARCVVSRTGYTGEDGFEVYGPSEAATRIWDSILEAGQARGVIPAGLGARDTLRLEARLALYGNDIDDTTTPWEAGLGWIVKMKKGDFVGRAALERQKAEGVKRQLAGFTVTGRGIARHGYPVAVEGTGGQGVVTSGTITPTVGKPIGLAYLPAESTAPGTGLSVAIRGKGVAASVVPTPFYKRKT